MPVEKCNQEKTRIGSQPITSLEEEISGLRNTMEIAVGQEKSFTSDRVVQLSSMLDRKINEYMKCKMNI